MQGYYDSCEYLLRQRESERILLYLPFNELANAPKSFKDAYMTAWWHLTNVYDAAENFHEGDTFEVDARPNGELERVVKCAHLIPWLIKAKYIGEAEITGILHNQMDKLLIQSICDTFQYINDYKLISSDTMIDFKAYSWGIPLRKKYNPIYISKKREEWINEQNKAPGELITPGAHLEGPFSPNIDINHIEEVLDKYQIKHPEPNEIILIGGSRLKGYGTVNSDFDIWKLEDLKNDPEMFPGSPHSTHIYFNTIWVGGKSVRSLDKTIKEIISLYDNPDTKRLSLERLESDLLQYRLLHKGFSRFTGIKIFETSSYLNMNGDCPFYDDEYRRIATMLYAKYVLIPEVKI